MTAYHGLGRIEVPDERDRSFLLAAQPRATSVAARRSHLWAFFDKPLDQGSTGTCVGHGWKAWLSTAPVIQSDVSAPPSALTIYDEATQLDEFDANDHDVERQYGTSVRAGAKALRARGFLSEFHWTHSVDECADWLAGVDAQGFFVGGPLVIGVNWYDSMFDTDVEGFLHAADGAGVAGGHCVCLTGWNERAGFAYGLNSWGRDWGKKGRFYMPGELLSRLLSEGGEACASAELRVAGA